MKEEMKIWLVERPGDYVGYDEYDSFVCRASTEEEARTMFPDDHEYDTHHRWNYWNDWINEDQIHTLIVTLLGVSDDQDSPPSVILASFNAG